MFKWLVVICGGIGTSVWDREVEIEAENIRQALDKAEQEIKEENCAIVSIEEIEGRR